MSRALQHSGTRPVPAPTATYKVRFGKRNGADNGKARIGPAARIPRVTRLLSLAHRIDGMIRAGELKDLTEAARLLGVTRARMTQIANLLLLSPEIQEVILSLPPTPEGQDRVTERDLRSLHAHVDWLPQRGEWKNLTTLLHGSP